MEPSDFYSSNVYHFFRLIARDFFNFKKDYKIEYVMQRICEN